MARLTNNQISKMPIEDVVEYSKKHPAESSRIAKILLKASYECGKVTILHVARQAFPANPEKVTIDLQ